MLSCVPSGPDKNEGAGTRVGSGDGERGLGARSVGMEVAGCLFGEVFRLKAELELELDEASESSESELDSTGCLGCGAGTLTVTFGPDAFEEVSESESEDDSEDEEATRRLRFLLRFLACGGFGFAGAIGDEVSN